MSRSLSLCGIILAAGTSSRMGRDKALLPWPPPLVEAQPSNQTFLSAAIEAFSPYSEMVIVVAGHNEANLAPIVYAHGASLVRNPEPDRGQFSSLQTGLKEILNRGRDAVLVTLVDRPPARAESIESLRDAFAAAERDVWAVVPQYQGKHGHPYIAGRELMEAFLRAPATATARDVEHQHQAHIQYLEVNDPFVTLNVDTPEEYASLQKWSFAG
jgi:molybdenum cofactor cytidylyltransferase